MKKLLIAAIVVLFIIGGVANHRVPPIISETKAYYIKSENIFVAYNDEHEYLNKTNVLFKDYQDVTIWISDKGTPDNRDDDEIIQIAID